MQSVVILGASGFAGGELMRLCAAHPELEVVAVTGDASAGKPVSAVHPHLSPSYPGSSFETYSPEMTAAADLTFVALPHGGSQALMPELLESSKCVVDLAGDFRFDDPATYEAWYGGPHLHPELLGEFAFGLPELFRDRIAGAGAVAAAGCYVTAASLALAPVLAAGLIEPTGIVVDAASGVTGAGRALKHETAFTAVDESFSAYGLIDHRHTPEIEMALSGFSGERAEVVFTPHLAPMNRGILATCYGRAVGDVESGDVLSCLADAFADEPFVVVSDESPSTKATLGSNYVHLTARSDPRTGWVVVLAALDNLVKGAAGQAVQCANIMLGLPEDAGLTQSAVYP